MGNLNECCIEADPDLGQKSKRPTLSNNNETSTGKPTIKKQLKSCQLNSASFNENDALNGCLQAEISDAWFDAKFL